MRSVTDVIESPKNVLKEAPLSPKEKKLLREQLAESSKPRKKIKSNLKGIPARDQCQTPPYALLPLLSYIPQEWTVWESAAGMGLLAEAIRVLNYNTVIETEIERGVDFFKTDPIGEVQVTNVPFSIKFDWIEKSYENRQPFALLMPFETWAAARAQRAFQKHGINVILLNRRVNFYMPYAGWEGAGADYPVAWFCWGLPYLKEPVTYGHVPSPSRRKMFLPDWMVTPKSPTDIRKGAESMSKLTNRLSALHYADMTV